MSDADEKELQDDMEAAFQDCKAEHERPTLQALAKAQGKKGFWELADWMELVDQTDFAKLAADMEALEAKLESKDWIIEQVKEQARGWAQEARTQRSTVHEIYQLVTDATGEPGDWHGAKPVAALKAENARLRERVEWQKPYVDCAINLALSTCTVGGQGHEAAAKEMAAKLMDDHHEQEFQATLKGQHNE